MVADSAGKRMTYITSLLNFCKNFNGKGIDVDWEDYLSAATV
jgi:GH18 family chitinase